MYEFLHHVFCRTPQYVQKQQHIKRKKPLPQSKILFFSFGIAIHTSFYLPICKYMLKTRNMFVYTLIENVWICLRQKRNIHVYLCLLCCDVNYSWYSTGDRNINIHIRWCNQSVSMLMSFRRKGKLYIQFLCGDPPINIFHSTCCIGLLVGRCPVSQTAPSGSWDKNRTIGHPSCCSCRNEKKMYSAAEKCDPAVRKRRATFRKLQPLGTQLFFGNNTNSSCSTIKIT